MNWYLKVIKEHYADFNGRARRTEYWMFALINGIISICLSFFDTFVLESPFGIGTIYSLAVFVPGLALLVRRLHDVGKSGWMVFIILIPIVGAIWTLVLLCTDSVPGENNWGENPKGIGNTNNLDMIGKE